ncbi:MAG: Flp pilus assembly protein CpaB [Robiginitomaculum sp.]|nr:Flp pilus assembly protein CpaB [Robiginitomaculum sp.]MDQ7077710.1 Flp pilus assembly protein CpaB [Robiginitomaculum sp.]
MNPGRIIVLVIAGLAAVGAALMARNLTRQPEPQAVAEVPVRAPKAAVAQVLVARRDIAVGRRITPEELSWQEWPVEALNDAFVTQKKKPDALQNYAGAIARTNIAAGEPVSDRKLVNPGDAGFMAAVLAPGMRAVSVRISVETGAGGFILPNDRVDVLLTQERQKDRRGEQAEGYFARTILENVRVLAIDQSFKQVEDEEVVIGSTATLALNRKDAELLALAEASGNLSLALRSVADALPITQRGAQSHATRTARKEKAVIVYRYGQPTKLALKDQ